MRLLRSPVRQDILDSLSASGPATIAELAATLGLPADALYYHIRKLVDAGLVLRAGTASDAAGAARYALPAERMLLRYDVAPGARTALADVIAAALRSASRDFAAGLESGEAVTGGPAQNIRGGRGRGWLSAADVVELNEHLDRIWELFHRSGPTEDRQLMSFSCVFSPIEAKPPRRDGG